MQGRRQGSTQTRLGGDEEMAGAAPKPGTEEMRKYQDSTKTQLGGCEEMAGQNQTQSEEVKGEASKPSWEDVAGAAPKPSWGEMRRCQGSTQTQLGGAGGAPGSPRPKAPPSPVISCCFSAGMIFAP